MRQARATFRPEGLPEPMGEDLRSIMFQIGSTDRPTTPQDCRNYEAPILIWLTRHHPGDTVTEIWFSRPEILEWDPAKTRCGQDTVVEGGLSLASGQSYRFTLELHANYCNCAWCRDEDIVTGESEWVCIAMPCGEPTSTP